MKPKFLPGILLIFIVFSAFQGVAQVEYRKVQGAIIQGDTTKPVLSLVFTGHNTNDGTMHVLEVLSRENIKGSFFFTGDFYRNPENERFIRLLKEKGHYLGAHSNKHLLYCDWIKRDSLLVTEKEFKTDLTANYGTMDSLFGIQKQDAPLFLPPYEWYNNTIAEWTKELGLVLINNTPGTLSHADYTTPDMPNYRSSQEIWNSIIAYEKKHSLDGFILLIHPGTDAKRTDKFYNRLEALIMYLKEKNYQFMRVDKLLKDAF